MPPLDLARPGLELLRLLGGGLGQRVVRLVGGREPDLVLAGVGELVGPLRHLERALLRLVGHEHEVVEPDGHHADLRLARQHHVAGPRERLLDGLAEHDEAVVAQKHHLCIDANGGE